MIDTEKLNAQGSIKPEATQQCLYTLFSSIYSSLGATHFNILAS